MLGRAERPVSTPRCPPGAVSRRTCAAFGSSSPHVVHRGGGGQHVGSAGHRENRLADVGEIDPLVTVERHPPAGERVHPEERVVELPEGAPRVGEHVSHVVVHGLRVGDRLAVVQVLSEKERLGEQTVEGGELGASRGGGSARASAPARSRTGWPPWTPRPPAGRGRRLGENQRAMAPKSYGRLRIDRPEAGSVSGAAWWK